MLKAIARYVLSRNITATGERLLQLKSLCTRGTKYCLWAALLLLCACEGNELVPKSGGRLYEVLVVGDRANILRGILTKDMQALPQPEPMFDVSSVASGQLADGLRYTRNIVILNVNPHTCTRTSIRYEKNTWAHPQIVIHVNTPNLQTLRRQQDSIAPLILQLLEKSERAKQLDLMRHKRNTKAEKVIRQMFGADIWIPADMTVNKRGKDFIWLSNNSPTTMQNIVMYQCEYPERETGRPKAVSSLTPTRFIQTRNYMLGLNIKGETDSMFMTTVPQTVIVSANHKFYRGLWEMHGDAMGGPFVSRVIARTQSSHNKPSRYIVAEGFVFAPGKKKRNAVKRLEAALYTLNIAKNSTTRQIKTNK